MKSEYSTLEIYMANIQLTSLRKIGMKKEKEMEKGTQTQCLDKSISNIKCKQVKRKQTNHMDFKKKTEEKRNVLKWQRINDS